MDRDLCTTCGGDGVIAIRHGVSTCPRCKGDSWEPVGRPPEPLCPKCGKPYPYGDPRSVTGQPCFCCLEASDGPHKL